MTAAERGESVATFTRTALTQVVSEACPSYRFTGMAGASLIRDLATANGFSPAADRERDDASDRLARFSQWSRDVAQKATFAPQSTSTAGEIVPPGYRAAVEIALTADRPLAAACDAGSIDNAAPFFVPRASGDGTVHAARVEGSNPAGADPVFGEAAVSPIGLAGSIELTRELVDSASPGGDLIALALMREDWYRQAEIRIYAALNAATGVQTAASATPATTLYADLRKALASYANVRRRKARNVVAGAAALSNLAGLIDFENGDDTCLWRVMGARVNAAVNDFGTTASDARLSILGSGDVVNFESPLVEFRFDDYSGGPALVKASVWGYHAVAVARPSGVGEITFA